MNICNYWYIIYIFNFCKILNPSSKPHLQEFKDVLFALSIEVLNMKLTSYFENISFNLETMLITCSSDSITFGPQL